MTHVITQNCCNDANCVAVCPVGCIRPAPGEPAFGSAEMLYIDPSICTDCGVCVDACPVDAIYSEDALPAHLRIYRDVNAQYFSDPARRVAGAPPPKRRAPPPERRSGGPPLRVAIVGSGPAGSYAAEELLTEVGPRAQVDLFERLPVPGGLVRYGVAPDHAHTKRIASEFDHTMRRVGFRLIANVDVGRDVTHAQLASRYHAVIYAVGAMADRALGIPGEHLEGSHSATEFVAWYNGHPDHARRSFDLSGERAVVIGNGNVALDVARVLLGADECLRRTDIADRALESLADSQIREVVIVGRRGPAEAAFTTPELLGLLALPDVDVVVPASDLPRLGDPTLATLAATDKQRLLHGLSERPTRGGKRIVLRFLHSPTQLVGARRVEGIQLARNELVREGGRAVARATAEQTELACGLVLRAVGYRGSPISGLPFDEVRGTLSHSAGRVIDPASAQPLPGVYATGWIKRGPSGVIGTNKMCAHETVSALMADYRAGKLAAPSVGGDVLELAGEATDLAGWLAIDRIERRAGQEAARPRVKITDRTRMLEVARRR